MATKILTAATALALCALATGCGRHTEEPSPPSASDSATTTAAPPVQESAPDASGQSALAPPKDDSARIRRAIREFIAEKYPSSEVEGVWVLGVRGNYCVAGADTIINSRHRNVDVLVRQYVRDDGSEYWRGEGFGSESAHMIQSHESTLKSDAGQGSAEQGSSEDQS